MRARHWLRPRPGFAGTTSWCSGSTARISRSCHACRRPVRCWLERLALPAAWRDAALVTYPVELPDARRNALSFVAGWLRLQQLEPLPGRTQADTYLACAILGEALEHAVDSYLPDYLVERIELMAGSRRANGYYPRLGLGVGQRFASKGGYLVRVGGPNGPVTAREPGWIVP